MREPLPDLLFVAAVSDLAVLGNRLLASPCFAQGAQRLLAQFHATSAAQAFNETLAAAPPSTWVVWVHQDVVLPAGWEGRFRQALAEAGERFPSLAVAGVYGVAGTGAAASRAGHVLDRGHWLHEAAQLPCEVDSLDELLLAVRGGSGLQMDPALGFDFYATDLVLQAQARGCTAAVVDAPCEHWSSTPASGAVPLAVVERIRHSARVFERKWVGQLPVTTPCFHIDRAGAVEAFIDRHVQAIPGPLR